VTRPPWIARLTTHVPPGQFGRYLVVGAWNTLFGYSTFVAFTALMTPMGPYAYLPAMALSNLVNITMAFLGYKWFVFRTKGNYLREWWRCVVVYSSGSAIGFVALPVLVTALRYFTGLGQNAPYVAGALLMGFGLAYNFVGHKRFSFRDAAAANENPAACIGRS
jgi:putative flippase GtrA